MFGKEPFAQQPSTVPFLTVFSFPFSFVPSPFSPVFFALLCEAKPGGSGCLHLMEGGLSPKKGQWEPWTVLPLLVSRGIAFWSALDAPGDAIAAQHQHASPLCQAAVVVQDCRDHEMLSSNSAFGSEVRNS